MEEIIHGWRFFGGRHPFQLYSCTFFCPTVPSCILCLCIGLIGRAEVRLVIIIFLSLKFSRGANNSEHNTKLGILVPLSIWLACGFNINLLRSTLM